MATKKISERITDNKKTLRLSQTPPFPYEMLLELTNACNDSCVFCPNSKMTRKKVFISKELTQKILTEAYTLGTREVGFYGTGESLLDKNMEAYVAFAKKLGYTYTYLTTNGALLTKDRAKTLITAGLDSIKFSINGATNKEYRLIHGKDEFNTVIKNLKDLFCVKKELKATAKIYISFVKTRYTEKNIDSFMNEMEQYLDDKVVFIDCQNAHGLMPEINDYLSIDADRGSAKVAYCPMVFNRFFVTSEGYMTLCCSDFQCYLAVADLNKESLQDAWVNKYAKEIRKKHIEQNTKGLMCYNCLNNCKDDMLPIRKELATVIDISTWRKD